MIKGNIMKLFSTSFLLLMLICGVVLSSIISWGAYQYETSSIKLNFKNDVNNKLAYFERDLMLNLEVLFSIKGFFDNSTYVSLKEFTTYSQSILDRHKSIQALEWVPKVLNGERKHFFSEHYLEDRTFEITELDEQQHVILAAEREFYFPIYFLQPLAGNEIALGYDLASERSRKETLLRAQNSGKAYATPSIKLIQEAKDESGFLIVLPLYNGFPQTVQSRQINIKGFIVGAFRFEDIFRSSLMLSPFNSINIKLIDITNDEQTLLYQNHNPSVDDSEQLSSFSYQKKLSPFLGREWRLMATPSLAFINNQRTFLPLIYGVICMFLIFMAAYYTYIIMVKNQHLKLASNRLAELCDTDALTTLANRRCFEKQIQVEWNRAIREETAISLLMIDVDNFKLFNDIYGHVRGDNCLKEISLAMKHVICRPSDLIARYGGEEFVIILPSTTKAINIAEVCRKSVEELCIPHQASSYEYVTISIGATTAQPQQGDEFIELISTADRALYMAKDAGRNNVIVL